MTVANKSGRIGRQTENGASGFLVTSGAWPHAEPRVLHGAYDQGDITGTPGVCWQVKGGEQAHTATDLDIEKWMGALLEQTENAEADVGVLVVKRKGYGNQRAGDWWAYMTQATVVRLTNGAKFDNKLLPDWLGAVPLRMHLRDAVDLLRWAGYGTPFASA